MLPIFACLRINLYPHNLAAISVSKWYFRWNRFIELLNVQELNNQLWKMKVSLSLYFTKMYFPIVSNHIFFLMSNFYGHCLLWRRSHIVVLLSEWAMVTIEYERPVNPQRSLPSFTRYSSLLSSVCFGTSSVVQRPVTISSNRFECYTEYWQVIILFFGANLSFVS